MSNRKKALTVMLVAALGATGTTSSALTSVVKWDGIGGDVVSTSLPLVGRTTFSTSDGFQSPPRTTPQEMAAYYPNAEALDEDPNFYAAGSVIPTGGNGSRYSITNTAGADLLGRVQYPAGQGAGTQSFMFAWDVPLTTEPLATLSVTDFEANGSTETAVTDPQVRFLFQDSGGNWYASSPFTSEELPFSPSITNATTASWFAYTPHNAGTATIDTAAATGLDFTSIQRVGYYQQFTKVGSDNGGVFSTGFLATVGTPSTGDMPGDFNGDGVVNLADYTVWRDNLGATEDALLNNNGTGGIIDTDDYNLWKSSFTPPGAITAAVAPTAVPEPGALGLLAVAATLLGYSTRRRARS